MSKLELEYATQLVGIIVIHLNFLLNYKNYSVSWNVGIEMTLAKSTNGTQDNFGPI